MKFWALFALCLPAVLGVEEALPGIVGGGLVVRGSFPFLVNRNHQCGGCLIAPQWFVTGAHCDMYVGEFVDINRWDLSVEEPQAERIRVAEVHPYPKYVLSDVVNDLHDIKLVRLAHPVNHTHPARLPHEAEIAFLTEPGQLLIVAGWGAVTPADVQGVGVDQLRAVQLPVVANEVCKDEEHYGPIKPVYETMMCAGFEAGGKDACTGDSGGPLFAMIRGEGVIVGVTSWALGCAQPKRPGVYTRVWAYRQWINDTMAARDAVRVATLPPVNSCQGMCGNLNAQTGCFCESHCQTVKACCADFRTLCVAAPANASRTQVRSAKAKAGKKAAKKSLRRAR